MMKVKKYRKASDLVPAQDPVPALHRPKGKRFGRDGQLSKLGQTRLKAAIAHALSLNFYSDEMKALRDEMELHALPAPSKSYVAPPPSLLQRTRTAARAIWYAVHPVYMTLPRAARRAERKLRATSFKDFQRTHCWMGTEDQMLLWWAHSIAGAVPVVRRNGTRASTHSGLNYTYKMLLVRRIDFWRYLRRSRRLIRDNPALW